MGDLEHAELSNDEYAEATAKLLETEEDIVKTLNERLTTYPQVSKPKDL
jgi:hypothetical protein